MTTLAASTLGLGIETLDGRAWSAADARDWSRALKPLADGGYRAVELASTFLDLAALPVARRRELRAVLDDLGLAPVGLLLARRSVIEDGHGVENVAATLRAIDAAAEAGIPVVCTGLHGPLSPEASAATWFWSVPDAPPSPGRWHTAVDRMRAVAEHAGARGVRISLELYERTFLGDATTAARFVEAVGHPACGINADLGNLLRAPEPVPGWEEVLRPLLPYLNYWHVKNCQRVDDRARGLHLAWPVEHAAGIIDYRRAIALARHAGFDGTVVVEHYGGDAVGVIARAHPYLVDLLEA